MNIPEGESTCVACEHTLAMHFQAVDGKVYCLVLEHHVSTSGVIGLHSEYRCDCVDYHSKNGGWRRENRIKEAERNRKLHEDFMNHPKIKQAIETLKKRLSSEDLNV